MAGGRPSLYTAEERAALLKEWEASGISASDFAGLHQGMRPQWLHQWRWVRDGKRKAKPAPARPPGDFTVVLQSVTVDKATYGKLVIGALEASELVGRHVTPVAFAAAVLKQFLTGGSDPVKVEKAGKPHKEHDGTQEGPRRSQKGRRIAEGRGSQAGQPVARRKAGGAESAARTGWGAKGAGQAAGRTRRRSRGFAHLGPEHSA